MRLSANSGRPRLSLFRGIREAVTDQFYDKNIVIGLRQCHRINGHAPPGRHALLMKQT